MAYVAAQLGIRDVACLADYAARPTTAWEHAAEIRRIYGFVDFTDPAEGFRLVRWLYTRAWLSSEQPSVLFDLATARFGRTAGAPTWGIDPGAPGRPHS